MIDRRPLGIAQADQKHFYQSAFDRAGETGVRLDAVADQHVVGLEGQAVEMDAETPLAPGTTTTVSMLERIGQPTNCSVMP